MKQCDAYYEAVERGDTHAMQMLYLPTPVKPLWMIQSEARFREIEEKFRSETEFFEGLSPDLMDAYMKMKLKGKI